MISFEDYIDGLKELQEEHKQLIMSARRSTLILDSIVANAKEEQDKIKEELDMHSQRLANYKKQSTQAGNFTVRLGDLMDALAITFGIKARKISAHPFVYGTPDIGKEGYINIEVKSGCVSIYYYNIGINGDTKFTDGSRVIDTTIDDENMNDLNININLNEDYMNDSYFVEALRLCFKKQEQNQNKGITQ